MNNQHLKLSFVLIVLFAQQLFARTPGSISPVTFKLTYSFEFPGYEDPESGPMHNKDVDGDFKTWGDGFAAKEVMWQKVLKFRVGNWEILSYYSTYDDNGDIVRLSKDWSIVEVIETVPVKGPLNRDTIYTKTGRSIYALFNFKTRQVMKMNDVLYAQVLLDTYDSSPFQLQEEKYTGYEYWESSLLGNFEKFFYTSYQSETTHFNKIVMSANGYVTYLPGNRKSWDGFVSFDVDSQWMNGVVIRSFSFANENVYVLKKSVTKVQGIFSGFLRYANVGYYPFSPIKFKGLIEGEIISGKGVYSDDVSMFFN